MNANVRIIRYKSKEQKSGKAPLGIRITKFGERSYIFLKHFLTLDEKTKPIITLLLYFSWCSSMAQAPVFDWVKQMYQPPCVYSAYGQSIVLDASGNIYTTGAFSGTIDFDPGPGVYNLSGSGGDIYISKLDPNGNFLWAKAMGSFSGAEYGQDIAIDNSNNIYVTGTFMYTVDFDPGPGVYNLATTGGKDIFTMKLDANGNFIWAKKMGGTSDDYGISITLDNWGNVHTLARFTGIGDFDPGAGTFNLTSNGSWDVIMSKLDSSGNFIWAKQLGGTGFDQGSDMMFDPAGNIFMTGAFVATVDFDPGPGTYNLTAVSGAALYVLKLDVNGNFVWARAMGSTGGGSSGASGRGISLDDSGSIYTSGEFKGTVDFDPGPGVFNQTVPGGGFGSANGIFISKLDSAGNFVWAKKMGGATANDFGGVGSLVIDTVGSLYIGGYYGGTFDFDSGPGSFNITSSGGTQIDPFITKLTSSGNLEWVRSFGGPNADALYSMTADGNGNIYSTGYFGDTCDFDPSPDSVVLDAGGISDIYVHKLKVCNATSSSISVSDCNSYTSPSGNYIWTVDGTYLDTIVNENGCDSIITINLTINSTNSSFTVTACDSMTSPSGNYTWTSSGTFMDTIPNSVGCDSVMMFNLTINTVDTSVSVSGATLTANASGATYQWLNCDSSNSPIAGETSQSYMANGNYAVVITKNGCTDTSACFNINSVGIVGIINNNLLIVFPNPSIGTFMIQSTSEGVYSILNELGQPIQSVKLNAANKYSMVIENIDSGVYFIVGFNNDQLTRQKVVVTK